jgi:signal peptidase I
MLDTSWKIAALVGALILVRIAVGLWRQAPHRVFLVEIANSALIAFALVFLLIRPFLIQAFYIPSGSMEPTLHAPNPVLKRPGDRILVNKFIYRLEPPRRGDIIVFAAPPAAVGTANRLEDGAQTNNPPDYVKRVIGLPGDRILVVANKGVYINGQKLIEKYIAAIPDYNFPLDDLGSPTHRPYVVPKDCIFVLGDNRNTSNDSHAWWDPQTRMAKPEVALNRIQGRALVIFWPWHRLGRLAR